MATVSGPLDIQGPIMIDGRTISRNPNNNLLELDSGAPISYERDNYQVVSSESDLPSASNGVITLEQNTYYELNGLVSTSNTTVGFDQTTVGWAFNGNTPIPDSSVRAQVSFSGNSTATTISNQSEWTALVGYTANSDSVLERVSYTHDSNNDTAFFTARSGRALVQSFMSVSPKNNNQDVEFSVFRRVNGTWSVISDTITPVRLNTAGQAQFVGLNTYVNAVQGNDFQLQVRNTGGTGDVTVRTLNTTVSV